MPNIDLKFYLAVFLRRLPYFAVIAVLVTAVAVTLAAILPPSYRSEASMLVEPQQIPGELAQATVEVDPYEQAQIIEQRIMTRTNLLQLAERIGLYADQPEMSGNSMVGDIAKRIEFIGFEPDVTRTRGVPGATIIGVAFEGPTAEFAVTGANELVNLVLAENVKLRTNRAEDTSEFFRTEVDRLAAEIERQSERIAEMKTANVDSLPDSLASRRAQQQLEQERLLALEREEAALRNQRATVLWVFERTGRTAALALSPEEEELEALRSQLRQQSTIYAPSSPQIRLLQTRISALEELVEEQRAQRAVPDAEGNAIAPASEIEVELAPIDARLDYIAQDKAAIQATLTELDGSIQATPTNEMTLAGLERELSNLSIQYENAVARLGQAAIGERIEVLSKGERFSLIQPPTEPSDPSSPNRVLIASAGVVGGVGMGLGFVMLLELLNRSIRRPVEIADRIGVQPFATIPYIRTRREQRWKRSVITGVLLAIVVAIPLTLLAVHTFYQPLDTLVLGLEEQPEDF
jgi:polysaccharide chain length determinant protein (PEP-CTERM system associated)